MKFSVLSSLSLLALAGPVLSCVQFSATIVEAVRIDAYLIDNGGKKCWMDEGIPAGVGIYELACDSGYSASLATYDGGIVSYSYGSFSGSFGTNHERTESLFDPPVDTYTASVWGC